MKHYIKPLDTWGPCDAEKEEEFHEKKFKYNERTFSDLLYFNFFGEYPSSSAMIAIQNHELKALHQNGERV